MIRYCNSDRMYVVEFSHFIAEDYKYPLKICLSAEILFRFTGEVEINESCNLQKVQTIFGIFQIICNQIFALFFFRVKDLWKTKTW